MKQYEYERKIQDLKNKVLKLHTEIRNLTFLNRGLLKTCSDLNEENLNLIVTNETLQCEIELLRGGTDEKSSRD